MRTLQLSPALRRFTKGAVAAAAAAVITFTLDHFAGLPDGSAYGMVPAFTALLLAAEKKLQAWRGPTLHAAYEAGWEDGQDAMEEAA